jgi:integrase
MSTKVFDTLAACHDTRGQLIVMLMVQMGLRCCEVAGLQRGDVDRGAGLVRVIGKGGHERIVPIPAEADGILADYLAEAVGSAGPLIRSKLHPQRGLAADTIGGLVVDYMKAAGIKTGPRDGVSAHALRHTAATDMLRAGAHIRDVQQVLGHAHLATTEVYMPLVVRSLADAMEGRHYLGQRLGERLGEVWGEPDRGDVGETSVHGDSIGAPHEELECEQLGWDLFTSDQPPPRANAEGGGFDVMPPVSAEVDSNDT